MFGPKKRHIDFVLPQNPEENKAPERTDEEINSISSDRLALGPAATEEDMRSYSGGNVPGSPSSYYNMLNGQKNQNPQQTYSQLTPEDNGIFVPFIPDGIIGESSTNPSVYSNSPQSTNPSEIIMLQRKIDELVDKIYLLERKIEKIEGRNNY